MSFCKNCKVDKEAKFCICNLDNEICPFVRRCATWGTWLPLSAMERCGKKNLQEKGEDIELKKGETKVFKESHGKLYLIVNGQTVRMQNPFDYIPKTVELIKKDGEYIIKTKKENDENEQES